MVKKVDRFEKLCECYNNNNDEGWKRAKKQTEIARKKKVGRWDG